MKNICIVTGTRAEYGLLRPLISKIDADKEMCLKLVVTGMHLSSEFGMTYQEIEADGFEISERIEMLLSTDTSSGVLKSIGLEMIGFADYFNKQSIDMIILLGDRYEIFIAAAAALIYGIPIAHIHGGEKTEGAVDEAFRHSITKMSTLHFASTEEYRRRIIQMGEQPKNVYNVGALGVENIKKTSFLTKEEVENVVGFKFDTPVFMVTYHPVTLEDATAESQMDCLLKALDSFSNCKVVFTKANSDVGGRIINQMIDSYVLKHRDRCVAFTSMGQKRYFDTIRYCTMVIGNSSSGIIEAPSFHIPTVNVGDRQRGRVCAKSIIQCGTDKEDIIRAIGSAFELQKSGNLKDVINPYEGTGTVNKIADTISQYLAKDRERKKQFFDIDFCI